MNGNWMFHCPRRARRWPSCRSISLTRREIAVWLTSNSLAAAAKLPRRSDASSARRPRKLGNRILALLGGRPVNPVGACIGGFARTPTCSEMASLESELVHAAGDWLPNVSEMLRNFGF